MMGAAARFAFRVDRPVRYRPSPGSHCRSGMRCGSVAS
jgi:hypothetical protein